MVSLPEDKALALLPELRDPKTIEAAQARLLKLVADKQATLVDWPQLTNPSGKRTVTESIVEYRYPVDFAFSSAPPAPPTTPDPAKKSLLVDADAATPTTFETRNTGTTLEVESVVAPDGQSVTAQISAQTVHLLREREFPTKGDRPGEKAHIFQPIFETQKASVVFCLRDGERSLIYVGKPVEPGSPIQLFIVGAKIIPALQPADPRK